MPNLGNQVIVIDHTAVCAKGPLTDARHFNVCRKCELMAFDTHDLHSLKPQLRVSHTRSSGAIRFRAREVAQERTADFFDVKGNVISAVKDLPLLRTRRCSPYLQYEQMRAYRLVAMT